MSYRATQLAGVVPPPGPWPNLGPSRRLSRPFGRPREASAACRQACETYVRGGVHASVSSGTRPGRPADPTWVSRRIVPACNGITAPRRHCALCPPVKGAQRGPWPVHPPIRVASPERLSFERGGRLDVSGRYAARLGSEDRSCRMQLGWRWASAQRQRSRGQVGCRRRDEVGRFTRLRLGPIRRPR